MPGMAWCAQAGGLLTKFDYVTGQVLLGPIPIGVTAVRSITVYGEPKAALVNGALTAIPALPGWMLILLAPVLAAIALLRLRSQ